VEGARKTAKIASTAASSGTRSNRAVFRPNVKLRSTPPSPKPPSSRKLLNSEVKKPMPPGFRPPDF
jgi:hypothetical protein